MSVYSGKIEFKIMQSKLIFFVSLFCMGYFVIKDGEYYFICFLELKLFVFYKL